MVRGKYPCRRSLARRHQVPDVSAAEVGNPAQPPVFRIERVECRIDKLRIRVRDAKHECVSPPDLPRVARAHVCVCV
jgi:hypothetical protein